MSMSFGKFTVTEAFSIAAINAIFNGSYTWWLWRSLDPLTLTGADGIAFDLAATPVWIAVLSTLLGTAAVRRKLWEGQVRQPRMVLPTVFALLPRGIALRATTLGLLAATVLMVPLWLALQASAIGAVTLGAAVLAKVVVTVVLTLAIVPVVILVAVTDMRPIGQQAMA